MRKASARTILFCVMSGALCAPSLSAQEASSGLDLRATLTAQAVASKELSDPPRSGSPMILGGRAVVYPTWKISDNWFVGGALQLVSRPDYYSDFSTQGYGAKGTVLQSTLNYSRVSRDGSFVVRIGEMSTTFGSFMLHYDDSDNALVDLPIEYGYYYSPVSILGVAGAEVDATKGKWDTRAQFANSSPANPRSLFAHDQYGNWAGGAGYTLRQGFRIGFSGYRGPYLDRKYQYYFQGEVNPSKLSATGLGLDVNWAHGHTSAQGEVQTFVMPYKAIPTYRERAGYFEVRQVLSPRWYIAIRNGYSSANASANVQRLEDGVGFRVNRLQLIKVAYEYEHYSTGTHHNDNAVAIQFVTTLHKALGRK